MASNAVIRQAIPFVHREGQRSTRTTTAKHNRVDDSASEGKFDANIADARKAITNTK